MRVEEMIGQRIRVRRDELGMSQAQVGQRLGELLRREWPRQAVSAAERGERSFTAAELVAFALSLHTTVSGLLTPRADVTEVSLSDQESLPRDAVLAAVLPWRENATTQEVLTEMQETLRLLGKDVINASRALDPLSPRVQLLYEQAVKAMEVISLGSVAADEAEEPQP